ncbi:MAG: hypothetical protein IPH49_15890 [Ignavibacteria bacterium]|nr:hypothetical protein [Ignavibacteria bacterium]
MILLRATVEADGNHIIHRPATPEEIKEAMPDAMHWLPMSQDAVFDRSESMLFRLAKYDTTDASGIYHGTYLDMVETYRPFITHYARITEPK